MKVPKAQITGKNRKTNADTWGDLDTWEQRGHELIRGYLNDAPVRFGEEGWKLEWVITRWWAPENQTEKTPELLWMDEKNSHNRKQLWEDGIKLEPWILKRMEQDLRETLLRSSKVENDDEKEHQNYWDTPGKWKAKGVEPTMKRVWKILGKDIWLMMIHSYVKL